MELPDFSGHEVRARGCCHGGEPDRRTQQVYQRTGGGDGEHAHDHHIRHGGLVGEHPQRPTGDAEAGDRCRSVAPSPRHQSQDDADPEHQGAHLEPVDELRLPERFDQ